MGNICRSPSAEGVFRYLAEQRGVQDNFEIDSAGTGGWHIGNPPDERAQLAAQARGIDLSSLRARQVAESDLDYYDLIIVMDSDNLTRLKQLSSPSNSHKITLMLAYSESEQNEIPDPYYGGEHGFDRVLDLLEDACDKLIDQLLLK